MQKDGTEGWARGSPWAIALTHPAFAPPADEQFDETAVYSIKPLKRKKQPELPGNVSSRAPRHQRKKKDQVKGKMERQIERRASKTASRPAILWSTDGGWDRPVVPPAFAAKSRYVCGIAGNEYRHCLLACARDFGCLGDIGTSRDSPSATFGKRVGPGDRKESEGEKVWFAVVVGCRVLLLALATACLFTLPYLAMPCYALLFSFYLFFFIDAPGGRMEGWPSSFHVLQLVHLLLPRPQTLEKASSGGVVQPVSQEETTACRLCIPALNSTACWPYFPPSPQLDMECRFSLDSRVEEGMGACAYACACVWSHTPLGALPIGGMSCFFFLSFPSATTEMRCCDIPPCCRRSVCHCILMHPGVCLRSPCRSQCCYCCR